MYETMIVRCVSRRVVVPSLSCPSQTAVRFLSEFGPNRVRMPSKSEKKPDTTRVDTLKYPRRHTTMIVGPTGAARPLFWTR